MRMMSQHQRSDVRTNRMGQSSESLSVSGTSRRFLQPSALNRGQSPSIESSFYFDAEDHSLSSINELGTTRISLFSGSKGNMLAATSPEGMDGLHDTLGPVDMIITPSAAEDEPIVVVADEDDDDSEEERVDLGGQRNDIAPSARTLVKLGDQSTSGATQSTHRRTKLPHDMPTIEVSIVGLLRKNIGKDLSSVSMPVSLNEPLSALQRIAEELEYVELLNRASACACSTDRLKYVAAFAFSAHASNLSRARKPFNPLLGETYEWTSPTGDVCFVAEKVQHHPHVLAAHAESDLFTFDHFGYSKSKFWGKSIELTPVGRKSVRLKAFDEIYTWNRVNVHVTMLGGNKMGRPRAGTIDMMLIITHAQIIVEFFGDMIVRNTKTGMQCVLI